MRKKLAIFFLLIFVASVSTQCCDKVRICHKGKVIEVSVNAVKAHMDHGDTILGPVIEW